MFKESRETVWRPLIVIIDAGNKLASGLQDGLIAYRAGARVKIVAGVLHAHVIEFVHELLELFIVAGAIIHDDHLPMGVVLAQNGFDRADRQLLAIPGWHIDGDQWVVCGHWVSPNKRFCCGSPRPNPLPEGRGNRSALS